MKRLLFLFIILLIISNVACFSQAPPEKNFGNQRNTVNVVEFSANGSSLIAGGFFKIWDIQDNSEPFFRSIGEKEEYDLGKVINADISADRKYVAVVLSSTRRIEVYDIESTDRVKIIKGSKLSAVAFGQGDQIAYVSSNGNFNIGSLTSKKPLYTRKLENVTPRVLAWSPSGKYIAIGGGGDKVILLKGAERFEVIGLADAGGKYTTDLEFSPDSKYLAIASNSGQVTIVDSQDGSRINGWNAHPAGTNALAFHPEGGFLSTGGANRLIAIWTVPGGDIVKSWPAHEKEVTALGFSPDGNKLASGCINKQVAGVTDTKVWTVDKIFRAQVLAKAENPIFSAPTEKNLPSGIVTDQKRLALLIGNGMYQNGGILANPENDANDIAERLQNLGFDVMLFNNLDQSGFKKAIDDFGAKLSGYDVGLFYYAGHGIQVKGNNYLIPVDANLKSENDVEYDCVNAGRLLAKMEDAGSTTNIVILDACRDNPFERSWRRSTHGSGLAFMTAPAGSLISYATSPGATASDGAGHNGLFTSALLEYMDEANLSVLEMFQKVRTYVRQNSDGEQVPWESTSLEGNFYFKLEKQ